MTTREAPNVYNPHGAPPEALPVIYGFNAGPHSLGFVGGIVAEDGSMLGSHLCSHESYMRSDLGMYLGSRRDSEFRDHYPDGYRTEFVPLAQVEAHEGLRVALEKAAAREGEVVR